MQCYRPNRKQEKIWHLSRVSRHNTSEYCIHPVTKKLDPIKLVNFKTILHVGEFSILFLCMFLFLYMSAPSQAGRLPRPSGQSLHPWYTGCFIPTLMQTMFRKSLSSQCGRIWTRGYKYTYSHLLFFSPKH